MMVQQLWNKHKNAVVIIALVALFLVAIYQLGKAKGKKDYTINPDDLPNSGSGIPQTWDPTPLSDRLYKGMKGINWLCFDENGDMFESLAELDTDDMFTAVYLDFNYRHGDGETLREWVADETACGWASKAQYWKDKCLDRFDRLGLK